MTSNRINRDMWPGWVMAAGNRAAVCEELNGGAGVGAAGATAIAVSDLVAGGGLN